MWNYKDQSVFCSKYNRLSRQFQILIQTDVTSSKKSRWGLVILDVDDLDCWSETFFVSDISFNRPIFWSPLWCMSILLFCHSIITHFPPQDHFHHKNTVCYLFSGMDILHCEETEVPSQLFLSLDGDDCGWKNLPKLSSFWAASVLNRGTRHCLCLLPNWPCYLGSIKSVVRCLSLQWLSPSASQVSISNYLKSRLFFFLV